ncbi:MAG: glucosamine-6-phosphate deaminase [Propionibacteriaceae bacterium]|nr:glucosamine-6-phosphate deaminase [Propionibacteriaceae bacterium]
MEVIICNTEVEIGATAAAKVAKVTKAVQATGRNVVIGVATGSSPLSTYAALKQLIDLGELDLSQASAFALDEYVGLPTSHPESYREVIRRTVTQPLGLAPERVHVPDGAATDLEKAGADYDAAIKAAGGVDVQILGVGSNGHIGFNEPISSLSSRTRMVPLTEQTRRDNARFFSSIAEVPTRCLTQGLGTIMEARHCVLVATGVGKAAAVKALVEGPVQAMCPASVLQLHESATIIIDEAAAAQLELKDYYLAQSAS